MELHGRFRWPRHSPGDGDGECGPAEAQAAQSSLHGCGQAGGSRRAVVRKLLTRARDLHEQARRLSLARLPRCFERAESIRLGRRTLPIRDDGVLTLSVFPLERVDERKPLLHRRERRKIVLDAVCQGARLGCGILQLCGQAEQPLGHGLVAPVQTGKFTGSLSGLGGGFPGATPLPGQGLVDLAAAASDRLGVLGGGQFPADLRSLAVAEPGGDYLARLMLLQLQAPCQFPRIECQFGQDRLIGAPRIHGRSHGLASAVQPPERVEQLALPALLQQSLLVVLAVDLDESAGHSSKPRRRHRFVVHSGGRSAGGGDLAYADERLRDSVEKGLDPCRLGTMADQ